jgi:hypothetical protein
MMDEPPPPVPEPTAEVTDKDEDTEDVEYKPTLETQQGPVVDHASEYVKYTQLTMAAARYVAPYQSPTFRSHAIHSDGSKQVEMVRVITRVITDDPNVRVERRRYRADHTDSTDLLPPPKTR